MPVWLLVLLFSSFFSTEPSAARINDSAARSVALIQQSQKNWYSKADCASCHHQNFAGDGLPDRRDNTEFRSMRSWRTMMLRRPLASTLTWTVPSSGCTSSIRRLMVINWSQPRQPAFVPI